MSLMLVLEKRQSCLPKDAKNLSLLPPSGLKMIQDNNNTALRSSSGGVHAGR